MGLIKTVLESTPVVGQVIGLATTAGKIYNATSPTQAVIMGIEGVLIDCTPPNVKYPLKCLALGVQTTVFLFSVTNPVTAPFSFALVVGGTRQVMEERLKETAMNVLL